MVSDRFADSTRAYQGIVQGAGLGAVEALYQIAVGELAPDLTLVLDLPVETGLARAAERGGENRYERMGEAFHRRLRDAFLEIAAADPDRCVVIDATAGIDAIAARIAAVVEERLL